MDIFYRDREWNQDDMERITSALSIIALHDVDQMFEFCNGSIIVPQNPRNMIFHNCHQNGAFVNLEKKLHNPLDQLTIIANNCWNIDDINALSKILIDRVKHLKISFNAPITVKSLIPLFTNAYGIKTLEITWAMPEEIINVLSDSCLLSLTSISLLPSGGFRNTNKDWENLGLHLSSTLYFPVLTKIIINSNEIADTFRDIIKHIEIIEIPNTSY